MGLLTAWCCSTSGNQPRHSLWWVVVVTYLIRPISSLVFERMCFSASTTQADAHRLVHRIKAALASGWVLVFTSDGLRQYFYALTAHFGQWVEEEGKRKPVWQVLPSLLYGQFRKVKVGRKLKQVYTKMLCGERSVGARFSSPWG
jgi:hypothetical protein